MEVTNCTDINGVALNEVQFNVDGTVVGIYDNDGIPATTKLSYDCCVAQGYTFDPTDAKCYWAPSCLSGGTFNIVLDPESNTGALFQVDDIEQTLCHLEISFKFLLKIDCESIPVDGLRDLLETLKLTVNLDKVIYNEALPIPNNLQNVSSQDLFNITDIFNFLSGNTNTGILLNGNCDYVITNFLNSLSPNQSVVNEFSLNSDWLEFKMVVDNALILQSIFNERLKVSITGNQLKNFSILLDDVQLNRVCDVPTPPKAFNEACPQFELKRIIDNKKSWVKNTELKLRQFDLERRLTAYNINHESLSINTKEVDLAINPAQAIENDVVNTVVNNDCILGPLTGVTGATSHEYIDLRPLITTEVINNDDLISMLIDVKNRKTINGYPTLDLVYYRYLNADLRCSGSTSNALNSDSINQFIELIGTYWSDLLEQIVPATTIWGSSLTNSDSGGFNGGGGSGTNKFVYRKGTTLFCNTINYEVPSPVSGGTVYYDVVTEDITDTATITTTVCNLIAVSQMNYGSEFIGTVNILGQGEGPVTGDTISITETIEDTCGLFETC